MMRLLLSTLLLPSLVAAGPLMDSSQTGTSIPLIRKNKAPQDRRQFLKSQADFLRSRYGKKNSSKRANTAEEPMTNMNGDVSYYGSVSIGTPGVWTWRVLILAVRSTLIFPLFQLKSLV